MEIRIYDAALEFLGISENQTSLIWTRRYHESGEFQLIAPATADNIRRYEIGNIVTHRGAREAGVIENLLLRKTADEHIIEASGRFLESYMDRRLIRPRKNYSGLAYNVMRQALSEVVEIPLVQLGEIRNGGDTRISIQATYKELLATETKISRATGLGFTFRPDFKNKKIYFDIYQGYDRSRNQSERAFVEFSDRFDNLNEAERRINTQLAKNVAYVGGEGEGEDRVFTTVGDDTAEGLERREIFVDAKDITSEELTAEEYKEKLEQRGIEKLAEQSESDSLECTATPYGNFNYKTDYDLGDIVTIRNTAWGVSMDRRITEISEVYQNEIAAIVPTFGDALPTKLSGD